MLQNWVGNGIGSGSSPLTSSKFKYVNLVIFWKQDGKSSSNFQWIKKMIKKMKREFFLKPWKVGLDKQREAKLDKLEKEGRIIRPNKNTQYIVKKGKLSNL